MPSGQCDATLEKKIKNADDYFLQQGDAQYAINQLFLLLKTIPSEKYYYRGLVYCTLGDIYVDIAEPDKAMSYYHSALQVYSDHQYNYGIADVYSGMATAYFEIWQLKKARTYFELVLFYLAKTETNNRSLYLFAESELARIDLEEKIYSAAEKRMMPLFSIVDTSETRFVNRANLFNTLSGIKLAGGDTLAALSCSDSSEFYARRPEGYDPMCLSFILRDKARLLIKQKKLKRALVLIEENEVLAKKHQANDYLESILKDKINVWEKLNYDKDTLINLYKELLKVKKKRASLKKVKAMAELEMNYEVNRIQQQKETEVQLQKKEKQLFQLQSYLYLALSLILLLGITGIVFWYRSRKKLSDLKIEKAIQEKELAYQKLQLNNSSLTELVLQTGTVHDKLTSLKDKVSEALGQNPQETRLQQLKNEINIELQHPAMDIDGLNHKVKSVKDELLFKLTQAHPSLSEKDKKLCTLLMLNISTKEIAGILNIQEKSVEKTRSRLRKKLGIDSSKSFQDYFNSL